MGILYTGRYDSGLWTFLTILIYILFFSLIFEIYEISKKKKFSILILLIILSLNFFIPSKRVNFENEKKTNQHYFDLAAFELIEKKDFYNISIKDFSDLNIDFLYHPVRFMIGLEIFKSNDGLYYYRNERSFWPINHQIIYQKNNLNNSTFIKTNIEEIQNINLFDSFWTKKIDNQNLNISFINNPNKKISSFEIINLKKILNLKKNEKIKIYLSNNFQTKNIKLLQGTNIYQTKIDKNGKIFFQIDNNNLDIKVFEDGTNITSQIKSIKFQSSKIFLDETLIILKKDYFEKNFIINNNHCRLIITNENFSDYRLDYYGIHKPEFTLNINFNKQTMDEKDLFSKFSNLTLKKKNIVVQNLKEKINYICN